MLKTSASPSPKVKKKVDRKWIKTEADKQAIAEGCYFDLQAAEHVRDFIAKYCRHSIGPLAGEPFTLVDWQWLDIIAPLYGWKRPDGRRRFKSAYIQVAKKNGKSTLIAALSLYHLLADNEAVPECYLLACDKYQAGKIYKESARMVKANEELADVLIDTPSEMLLACPANDGQIITLSNIVESKDGFNASLVIFDELHRQKTDKMWQIMRYAGKARRQSLRIEITTAGDTEGIERQSICWQQREYSKSILDGDCLDTTHLAVIYEPAKGADSDIDDPATWYAANPSLGITIDLEEFKSELQQAKERPSQLEQFKQLCLNMWVSTRKRFLKKEDWDACRGLPIVPEHLQHLPCFAGLDLATTTDIAALARIFPDDERDIVHVLMTFWLPKDNASEREKRDGVRYRQWADAGLIILTEGNVIDYRAIRIAISGDLSQDIPGIARESDLRKLGIDPYNAYMLAQQLQEEDGLPVEMVRQGFLTLSPATKEIERLVLSKKFHHGGNAVLDWMAGNAIVRKDPAGNIKLDKEKCISKIDGLAALVNAISVWISSTGDNDSACPYDNQGIMIL